MRPVGMYTDALRPKGNRPATGGHVDGRPKVNRTVDIKTGTSRPKGNRPAAGGHVEGRFAPRKETGLSPVDM